MYVPRLELRGFDFLPVVARCAIVLEYVKALVNVNRIEWRHARPPPMYQAGIQYAFQGIQDDWKDLAQVIATGRGSCNSLAAWRVAELLESGAVQAGKAGPYIRSPDQGSSEETETFHVIVWKDFGNGRVYEDPSLLLGMPVPPGYHVGPSR